MYYASLCAIAKDEDSALVEWVEYHLRVGFEHIYIFDNLSANPIRERLRDYIGAGLVTVLDMPLTKGQQLSAYTASLRMFSKDTVWMGYIDIDEFVVPKDRDDIRDLLDEYTQHAALAVNWIVFGSAGHDGRPQGGVINNYTAALDYNSHIKTILRMSAVTRVVSPHHFMYKPGLFCVNEDHVPVLEHASYHASRRIQLNHYYYKSREDFAEKLQRGLGEGSSRPPRDVQAGQAAFARQAGIKGENDEFAKRLYAKLRANGPKSPAELKVWLHGDYVNNAPACLQRIIDCIATNNMRYALDILARTLRCHDKPDIWAVAARMYLELGDKKKSFAFIVKLLQDGKSEFYAEGYKCLADYYVKYSEPEKAKRIHTALRNT